MGNRRSNNIKTAIFLFIAALSSSVLSSSVWAVEVQKNDWIRAMSTALPAAFCNSRQYFRQCFSVTAQECEETAASVTRICLNKNKDKIPAILNQPKDGTYWGTIVGACAGEAYVVTLVRKQIKNKRCSNPANWQ